MPTSTAAAPTKLCSIATSSGIAVISTRAASTAPITPPIAERAGQHAEDGGVGRDGGGPSPGIDSAERRDRDGEHHADDAETVPRRARLLLGEAAEAEDEEQAGGEVGERAEG